jgi:hypothetical protein
VDVVKEPVYILVRVVVLIVIKQRIALFYRSDESFVVKPTSALLLVYKCLEERLYFVQHVDLGCFDLRSFEFLFILFLLLLLDVFVEPQDRITQWFAVKQHLCR